MTLAALLIAATVLILVLTLVVAGLIELYRDMDQLRKLVGLVDEPTRIGLGGVIDSRPSEHDLPAELDERDAVVLFLADICSTCASILDELGPAPPIGTYICVASRSETRYETWLDQHNFDKSSPFVFFDEGNKVSGSLGLDTTPVALTIRAGRIVSAKTVPSVRWLDNVLAGANAASMQVADNSVSRLTSEGHDSWE